MTLDSRLNWEEHINKLRAKAKRALNTIKVVAGKKWGGDWKTLKKQYSAICKRKIHYVCQIYNTAFAGRLKKLDCILRENQNYEENERSIKPTGVHMRRLEQRYMREQMEIEEMNQTRLLWLVNHILFC